MCSALVSARGLKNEVNYTRSAFVSGHGLKNEVYSCVARLFWLMDERTRYIVKRACFGSWIKERDISMCSALVLAHGGLTAFPFVPMVPMAPIDKSFSHGR